MKKLIYAAFACCIIQTSALAQHCASNAYISNGGNCISLSWFPQSTMPETLPNTIEFDGSIFTLATGSGDIAFPAVYKKQAGDCALPSDYVNGDVTIDFNSGSITCQYPGGTLLALQDISLMAYPKNGKTVVQWSVENRGIERFLVENSKNGIDFTALASVAPNATTGKAGYSYIANNSPGNFYRIKVFENGNKAYYSKIVLTDEGGNTRGGIYPSPNKGSFVISGVSSNDIAGICIRDLQGRKLAFRSLGYDAGKQVLSVSLLNKTIGIVIVSYPSQNKVSSFKTIVE